MDGVYYASSQSTRTTHPFRIIEHDTASIQSMTSLGRVGRILSGSVDPSASFGRDTSLLKISESNSSIATSENKTQDTVKQPDSPEVTNNKIIFQEPDVIASTKLAHSKTTDSLIVSVPVAPPRKKKRARKLSSSSSEQFNMNIGMKLPPMEKSSCPIDFSQEEEQTPLPSPASAIELLTRELENSFSEQSLPKPVINNSLNRVCHSLGNSSTSVNSKHQSPSNSSKSNSAPGRANSIDPTQSLNIYKATRGQYVVKPQDEVTNKAEGPPLEEIERNRYKSCLAGTGTNSLGNGSRYDSNLLKLKMERRKSAGDEDIVKQSNQYVRTHTVSGKQLTDIEILEQVQVKNLDTGENFPLSVVEEKLPELKKKMNPLSFHIMRLTSEVPEMDEQFPDATTSEPPPIDEEELMEYEEGGRRLKKKTERIRRFLGSTMRKTVDKAKSIASEVSHARHKEDVADIVDVGNPEQNIKIKASSTNKGPYEFAKLQHVQVFRVWFGNIGKEFIFYNFLQDLSGDEQTGAVWCMKFSSCGRLLATAGVDKVLKIWVLKDAYPFFQVNFYFLFIFLKLC